MHRSIPGLTGLRFVAAATIVIAHSTSELNFEIKHIPMNYAAIGMPLFFTLSGFVIHYVYADAFQEEWRSAVKNFFIARVARLFPLFIFLFLFYLILDGTFSAAFRAHRGVMLSYVTMTATWWYWAIDGKSIMELPYGMSWSVSTEVAFYVAYAVALYPIAKIRRVRTCAALLVGLCIFAYAYFHTVYVTQNIWEPYFVQKFGFVSIYQSLGSSFWRWAVYVSPYTRLFEFIGGCLTCQLFVLIRRNGIHISRTLNELMFWLGFTWIAAAQVCLFVIWAGPVSNPTLLGWLTFINFLHTNFLMAPGCLMVILSVALGNCHGARIMSTKVPVFLGEISYSLYLGHGIIASIGHVGPNTGYPALGLAIMLVLTTAFAAGLYQLVECPAKAWIRAAFQSRRAAPSPSAASIAVTN